jgi:hypothetical protein
MALLTRLRSTRSSSTGSACATCRSPRKRQHQALFKGDGLEVQAQPREEFAQAQRRGIHVHAAGVDAGDVQQLAEQAFQRVDRFVDAVHQRGHLGVVAALAQRLRKQAHGVQRLAQVVAGGGEELRLGAVGGFGGAAASSATRRASSVALTSARRPCLARRCALLQRDGLTQRADVGARHQHGDAEQQGQDHGQSAGAAGSGWCRWRCARWWA